MATTEFVIPLDDIDRALLGTVKAQGETDEEALQRMAEDCLRDIAESALRDNDSNKTVQ